MDSPLLTSFQNPKAKFLRSLRQRKVREREGRFLVEGIRLVEEALAAGAAVETIVYAPELLVSERAQAVVEAAGPGGRLPLAADVFRSLSERDDPQGLAAVVRIEPLPLQALPLASDMLVVVAYQLGDPGNLGSIIRTADAVAATGVVAVAPCVDVYDPQTVRATMGSLFALPVVYPVTEADMQRWVAAVRAAGVPLAVVATSAHGRQEHYDAGYGRPLALLLGNERYGLPPAVRDTADVLVRLPMLGRATSINVSAAAAALLYEIVRQRR